MLLSKKLIKKLRNRLLKISFKFIQLLFANKCLNRIKVRELRGKKGKEREGNLGVESRGNEGKRSRASEKKLGDGK